jgi:hypothetical protein
MGYFVEIVEETKHQVLPTVFTSLYLHLPLSPVVCRGSGFCHRSLLRLPRLPKFLKLCLLLPFSLLIIDINIVPLSVKVLHQQYDKKIIKPQLMQTAMATMDRQIMCCRRINVASLFVPLGYQPCKPPTGLHRCCFTPD